MLHFYSRLHHTTYTTHILNSIYYPYNIIQVYIFSQSNCYVFMKMYKNARIKNNSIKNLYKKYILIN